MPEIMEHVGAIILKERKLLLVQKKRSWILPGGKPEPGEDDYACLERELDEELSGARIASAHPYRRIDYLATQRFWLRTRVYCVCLQHEVGLASGEIVHAVYFNRYDRDRPGVTPLTQNIMDGLCCEGHL